MSSEDKNSLWTDSTRSRCFLIPDHQELPDGDFVLCTLKGDRKEVALTALASFEITQEAAKAHLQAQMSQALEQTKSAFSNIMAFSAQAQQAEAPSTPTTSSNQPQSAQNLLFALVGVTPEELQHNPEAAQKGFLNFFTGLKEVLDGFTCEDSAQLEAARDRIRSLRATPQSQGIDVSEAMEELPDQLRELYSSSDSEQYLKEIVAKLQKFTDQIDQSPASLGKNIDELIKSLSKDLFIEEESRLQENRRQEYKKSAQSAIARSLKAHNIPSFAAGDLISETSQQPQEEQK